MSEANRRRRLLGWRRENPFFSAMKNRQVSTCRFLLAAHGAEMERERNPSWVPLTRSFFPLSFRRNSSFNHLPQKLPKFFGISGVFAAISTGCTLETVTVTQMTLQIVQREASGGTVSPVTASKSSKSLAPWGSREADPGCLFFTDTAYFFVGQSSDPMRIPARLTRSGKNE